MTTRNRYSKEFKLDAISLMLEQGYTRAEAARSLELGANMLGRWIKEHEADEGEVSDGCIPHGAVATTPGDGIIGHSDKGSQYASKACRCLLKANGFVGSMSRKGDYWDNAVAESFFASLKKEWMQWKHYQTRRSSAGYSGLYCDVL